MIRKHTGRWMWQGSASVVPWSREKYSCQSKSRTGLEFGKSQTAVENREKWRKLVAKSSVVTLAVKGLMMIMNPNWFQPCQCCCCLYYPGEYLRLGTLISYNYLIYFKNTIHTISSDFRHEYCPRNVDGGIIISICSEWVNHKIVLICTENWHISRKDHGRRLRKSRRHWRHWRQNNH